MRSRCGNVAGAASASFITQQTQGTIAAVRIVQGVQGQPYPRVTIDCDGHQARPN